ncbi:hypothetical protein JCM30237_21520 [Halolamina litorea]|uniref:Type II methyltransferase n=1 Tax=Halolamina litorea TaxID=1515593 RepID=A0ABD6BPT5_9EURY|nr:DNA methyltransferase [Halolamina litorea]
MQTHLSLAYDYRTPTPPDLDDDIRTPHALVETFLREYTDPGDTVFDPFAGYGTTLRVAERLDRTPYGLEYETDRVEYITEHVDAPANVRQGDVREFDGDWLPPIDCCFTSPPFMVRADHRNPFRNYTGESSYDQYLDDVEAAFGRVASVLAPGGHAVVDIVNMKYERRVTPLAWDVADRVGNVLDFEGEVVVAWESVAGDGPLDADRDASVADPTGGVYGYGYDHSYCLVFRNPEN